MSSSPRRIPAAPDHEALIAAARSEFERLRSRAASAPTVANRAPPSEPVGALRERLSGYEIVDEISRGGQGVVYRGMQLGTRREVAIKVLRDTGTAHSQARVRFEREVQILGQLRHPNIVTILDSGTAAGCSYYIMDYIAGSSLDEYFARERPPIRRRVELFVTICDALSAAHLRGVIHRDLKPGNIRIDPAGQPHLLDFGLARAEELLEEEPAAYTRTGDFVGSLPWASPEQVEGHRRLLDIRTDVYSIGVMFYHALTGQPPYATSGSLRTITENICNVDPEPPRALNSGIDGELDAIVLKCLRKRPEERYQSAGDLARELRRFLAGEPVEARGDSAWYLIRKTLRRNRGRATVAGLMLATLVACLALLAHGYRRETQLRTQAERARDEARRQTRIAEAVSEFLNLDVLSAVIPEGGDRDVTVRQVLEEAARNVDARFRDEPLVRAQIHFTLGNAFLSLGDFDRAITHFEPALALPAEIEGADSEKALLAARDLSRALDEAGRITEAEAVARRVFEARLRVSRPDDTETISARGNLGWVLVRLGRTQEGEALIRQAQRDSVRVHGEDDSQTLNWTNSLATLLRETGRLDEAAQLQSHAAETLSAKHGPRHPDTLLARGNLAELYRRLGRLEEAESIYRDVLAGRREVLGESHPRSILTLNNLAVMLGAQRRNEEAVALFEQGLRDAAKLPDDHPTLVSLRSNLAAVYDRVERCAEAEPLHRAAVEGARRCLPAGHPHLGLYLSRLGMCLMQRARVGEAAAPLREAYPIVVASEGERSESARACAAALADCAAAEGDDAEAARWRALAEAGAP